MGHGRVEGKGGRVPIADGWLHVPIRTAGGVRGTVTRSTTHSEGLGHACASGHPSPWLGPLRVARLGWDRTMAQAQTAPVTPCSERDTMRVSQPFVGVTGALLGLLLGLAGCTSDAALQRLSPAEQAALALYRPVMTPGQVHTYVGQPTAAARTAYLQDLGLVQRFQALAPFDQEAIRSGAPRVGMSADALRFLWGEPSYTAGDARRYAHWYYLGSSVIRSSSGYHPWDFNNRVDVYLVGGKIVGWVDVPTSRIAMNDGASGN